MMNRRMSRRRLAQLGLVVGGAAIGAAPRFEVAAQRDEPEGRIAFIKDGDIWQWSSEDGTDRLIEDGRAVDPTWQPRGQLLLYARDGGSYSDLVLANPRTGNRKRLTDNESNAEVGSPEYVEGCAWALDPFWSQSGIVCFISDAASTMGQMELWILLPEQETAYVAANDGGDQGPPEKVSVDAAGTFCAYTVLAQGGPEGGTTYITMRDLNMGTTYPLIEGPQGAYDPAISPDAAWIVATIRDENGTSDLWIFDRVEETIERLTDDEQASGATWSPDGEWIAYLRWEGSGFEIRALRIDPDTGVRVGNAKTLAGPEHIDSTSGISWGRL